MSRTTRPPRFFHALLRLALPSDARGTSVLGDLHAEYAARRDGARRDAWYAAHALRLAVGYGIWRRWRRAPASTPVERRPGGLLLDLRHAVRALLRRPTYLIAGVATLAIGIGADTAIFSVVWHSVLRPLPYENPGQLVALFDRREDSPPNAASNMNVGNFLELRERSRRFQAMSAYEWGSFLVGGDLDPSHVTGLRVTEDFFDVLGRPPRLGRDFLPEEDQPGASPVVILSDALWRTRYGADPDIIGRTIPVDLVPHTVVGVAPADMVWLSAPELWIPYAWDAETRNDRRRRSIFAVGRLADGATLESGLEELRSLFSDIRRRIPERNEGMTVGAQPLDEWTVGRGRGFMMLLSGAALLVLLIAIVNVVNLMLARAESRRGELALRRALGAGRLRAGWALLSESLVLAALGGAIGIPVAWGVMRLLLAVSGSTIPRVETVELNGIALLFAIGLSLFAGLLVGLVPVLSMDRFAAAERMSGLGRGTTPAGGRIQRVLVVAEVALGVMIVAAAGLLVNTSIRLGRVHMGIASDNALVWRVSLPSGRYSTPQSGVAFFDAYVRELASVPGVEAVGLATRDPLTGGTNGNFTTSRDAITEVRVEMRAVTPDWFRAIGQRVVAGRSLTASDATAPVVVVNQTLARTLFPAGDALGQELRATWNEELRATIAGVVSDVRDFGPTQESRPTAYWPFGGVMSTTSMAVLVRASGVDATSLLPALRDRLRALDADVPMAAVTTLDEAARRTFGRERRASTMLVSVFAAVALILAVLGIYAVLAFAVEERRREVGVRMALGATSSNVLNLVCARGLRLAGIGIVLGLAAAAFTGRLLAHLLWNVQPADPLTLAVTATVFLLAALLGSALPARRAARVQVSDVLRQT